MYNFLNEIIFSLSFYLHKYIFVVQKKFFFFFSYAEFEIFFYYFFKLLLKTRLKLFKTKKNKNFFNFLFLNNLKKSIKKILFKNKTSYYDILTCSFDAMNFYKEYKLWHLHFISLKKIPFKLVRLYSKFFFTIST